MNFRPAGLSAITLIIICLSVSSTLAQVQADTVKTAFAFRLVGSIDVNGLLDEPFWSQAEPITGFRQTEPEEGEPATESTLVKILYDDEALYVGFWCYDRNPEKIVRQLTRRDRFTESDKVAVRIDSHHDHRTAYYFAVNVSGVLSDIFLFNNDQDDDSWDAVWTANVKSFDWGWTAEFKIPYSALRFSRADEYVWGLNLSRHLPRNKEDSRWQFVPSHEAVGVSRYGHLAGIKDIEPPGRLETLPYFVSYGITEPKSLGNSNGRDFVSNIGGDLKMGLTSALTLDATINPDFGQVEADEAIINLGTYETQFEEKRPFFLEGSDIFRLPAFDLFYSRRIGRPPRGDIENAAYYINYPRNTTILSALKVTGKTGGGTSIGLLNATTQEEKTRFMPVSSHEAEEAVVEPLANYTVARFKQDVGGLSYIGGMFTSANQKDRPDAYTAAADGRIYFLNNDYYWAGALAATNNGPGTGGYAWHTMIEKVGGRVIRGNVMADYYDRRVDWNRLGYLNRNSARGQSFWIHLRSNKKFSLIRYLRFNTNFYHNKNMDGFRIYTGREFNGNVGFTNGWWFYTGASTDDRQYDDLETRGNGLWKKPRGQDYWIGMNTNHAERYFFELTYIWGTGRSGRWNVYEFWLDYRPVSMLEFSLGGGYESSRDRHFWVGTGEDGLPVFGHLDHDELSVTLRSTYTFTRDLTIQSYTQFYFSAGDYERFMKLTSPERFEEISASYAIDFARNDFNYKSLNVNLVLRWEYRPGSAVFVVWTHARDGFESDINSFSFNRDLKALFRTPQVNTFLIKANYWWNI